MRLTLLSVLLSAGLPSPEKPHGGTGPVFAPVNPGILLINP